MSALPLSLVASPASADGPRVENALAKWSAEVSAAPAVLHELRLDANDRLVVPFTTSVVAAHVHYLDAGSLRGYFLCPAPGCLLCRLGRSRDQRDLWPVYDTHCREVAILPVSPSMRPHSLRAVLLPVLQRVARGELTLVALSRPEQARFAAAMLPVPPGADLGEAATAAFLEGFEAGGLRLESIYRYLPDAELATVPELVRQMGLRGVSL